MSPVEARSRHDGWQRIGRVAALGAAVLYFLYEACKFRVSSLAQLSGDASIIFQSSLAIAEAGRYPAQSALGNFNGIFLYPPPAVLMFAVLAKLGPTIFMLVVEGLTFIALFAVVWLSVFYEDRAVVRRWPLLLLLAILLTYNPVEYDLFGRNVNLTILALTLSSFAMLRRAPTASGIALALAISLKLYSGLLLIWLIFYNRKAAISCITALGALWVVAPLFYWGPTGAVQIYRDWLDQLTIANGRWVYAMPGSGLGPPLITLRLAASRLVDADPFGPDVRNLLLVLQGAWVGILAIFAFRAWRYPASNRPGRTTLADWFVLLVAPLPFSPWLEPYHAVALIPGFVLCMLIALDRRQGAWMRLLVVLACLASAMVKELPISFAMRGLVFTAQFSFVILALSMARSAMDAETAPAVAS